MQSLCFSAGCRVAGWAHSMSLPEVPTSWCSDQRATFLLQQSLRSCFSKTSSWVPGFAHLTCVGARRASKRRRLCRVVDAVRGWAEVRGFGRGRQFLPSASRSRHCSMQRRHSLGEATIATIAAKFFFTFDRIKLAFVEARSIRLGFMGASAMFTFSSRAPDGFA